MAQTSLVVGRWYYAEYGFSLVRGHCAAITKDGAILRFRWGDLIFRSHHAVESYAILSECADPRLFGLVAWLKRASAKDDAQPSGGPSNHG